MCAKLNSCVNKCSAIVVSHLYTFRGEQSCIDDFNHRDYLFEKKDPSINQCMTRCHNFAGCGAVNYKESDGSCYGTTWHKDFGKYLPVNPDKTSNWKCYTKKGIVLFI